MRPARHCWRPHREPRNPHHASPPAHHGRGLRLPPAGPPDHVPRPVQAPPGGRPTSRGRMALHRWASPRAVEGMVNAFCRCVLYFTRSAVFSTMRKGVHSVHSVHSIFLFSRIRERESLLRRKIGKSHVLSGQSGHLLTFLLGLYALHVLNAQIKTEWLLADSVFFRKNP